MPETRETQGGRTYEVPDRGGYGGATPEDKVVGLQTDSSLILANMVRQEEVIRKLQLELVQADKVREELQKDVYTHFLQLVAAEDALDDVASVLELTATVIRKTDAPHTIIHLHRNGSLGQEIIRVLKLDKDYFNG